MSTLRGIFILVLVGCFSITTHAADDKGTVRLIITGGATGVPVAPDKVLPGTTFTNQGSHLEGEYEVDAVMWKPGVFRFIPGSTGEVELQIKGGLDGSTESRIYVQAVVGLGTKIKNGDFKDSSSNSAAKDWKRKSSGGYPKRIGDLDGKPAVEVSYSGYLSQKIPVTSGTVVTITILAKLSDNTNRSSSSSSSSSSYNNGPRLPFSPGPGGPGGGPRPPGPGGPGPGP